MADKTPLPAPQEADAAKRAVAKAIEPEQLVVLADAREAHRLAVLGYERAQAVIARDRAALAIAALDEDPGLEAMAAAVETLTMAMPRHRLACQALECDVTEHTNELAVQYKVVDAARRIRADGKIER